MTDTQAHTIMRHIHTLADEIGPRHAGSLANLQAAEYVADHFRHAGLTVEELPFECPGWSCAETILTLDGAPLHAAANTISPPCDLTAPTVAAGTVADLDAANITDKIVILYGNLTAVPLIPYHCPIYNDPRDQHINRTLLERQPAAVITVHPFLHNVERRIEDPDFTIPSATVPADVGARLLHRLGDPVHLRIVSEPNPAPGAHILGIEPDQRPARIALMAHFDTKIDPPGAWDNAGGMAAVLALADRLAERDLGCGLEFIGFADEETFGYDHTVYIEQRGDQFGDIIAAINLDGIAHILGHNTITIMAHSPAFEDAVRAITGRYPRVAWVDPWPQSNHSTFAWHGVPAIALSSSTPWNTTAHLPTDTPLWINPDLLVEAVDLVADIVMRIADKALDWSRPQPEAASDVTPA
ncbi:MAG: Zn-dependent exopeptidase M28 [Anaerolineae bacterium]|nr:Zn-dependent exopeptidase M28 [Anaerolineae bacterium]